MLLGNGDVGVCVTVHPDAIGLHLGKSDSWDIRVSEDHYQYVLPFRELLELWERASEEAKRQGKPDMTYLESNIDFFRQYTEKVAASYGKPWPRPWPCGIVWIHWDPRIVTVRHQVLDPSNGLMTLDLDHDDLRATRTKLRMLCFVDWETGLVSLATDRPAPFSSITYEAYSDVEARLPGAEVTVSTDEAGSWLSCLQRFPATAPTDAVPNPPASDNDRNFALLARLEGIWTPLPSESGGSGPAEHSATLVPKKEQPLRLDLVVTTPRDHTDNVAFGRAEVRRLQALAPATLQRQSEKHWREFWSRSAVEFEDHELERIWYHNQYFLACCLRQGKVAPGLFGNWTSGKIGTSWHGDYHMNYNTQQVFWGVFSSNHVDQHVPYVELVENLLPMSERYAREKFGLPGAYFPHSAYPVPSRVVAYPAPPWGYEVCETPWVVQSLWWQYVYTLDKDYLRRVYPMLRAATQFLAAYLKEDDDGMFHVIPTVSPENWGFTVDYSLNKDCIMDLALSRFVMKATVEASRVLELDADERTKWSKIADNLAPYPTLRLPFGEVWADVVGAPPNHVYNVPVTLAPVFPGEQVGIDLGESHLEIARRTAETVRLESGNDLVYQPLIRARLGMLDLDWFKREVRYCLLPGGWANDRVRQIGGRYDDDTNFDFMMRMGVWTENLSLPAVLNECLLQSYSGTLRLFPNARNLGRAGFRNLRAAGAFLVSAAWDGKAVSPITMLSEKGGPVRLADPWKTDGVRVTCTTDGRTIHVDLQGETWIFATEPGASYRIEPV
jgi:alpha-L-fucosidase 2